MVQAASAAATADARANVGISVARKTLDAYEQQGAAMVGLIKDAGAVAKAPRGAVSPVAGPQESGKLLNIKA